VGRVMSASIDTRRPRAIPSSHRSDRSAIRRRVFDLRAYGLLQQRRDVDDHVITPRSAAAPLLDDLETSLDDGERLHEVALEAHEDIRGVLVGATHRLGGLGLRLSSSSVPSARPPEGSLVLQEKRRLLLDAPMICSASSRAFESTRSLS